MGKGVLICVKLSPKFLYRALNKNSTPKGEILNTNALVSKIERLNRRKLAIARTLTGPQRIKAEKKMWIKLSDARGALMEAREPECDPLGLL